MTPQDGERLFRSLEDRAIEHTLLLTRIAQAAIVTAICSLVTALVIIFR